MSVHWINRREFLAAATAAASALSAGALGLAQGDDFSKVQMKTRRVAGNIYMLQGAGGNIAASVGDDGICIVDDEFAPLYDKIRQALREISGSDKPVRFVINTHYHGDHTGSNAEFGEASTIVAHHNVRKRLADGGPTGNGRSIHMENKPASKVALPIVTFEHDVTVHLNGEDIHALHFPSGHTDGDSVIFYAQSNVVHMGDDFVTYGFPFIDTDGGGSVQGMIAACEKVLSQGLPADVKVIPGHGGLSGLNDMRPFVKMLHETTDAVEKALKQGMTLEEMKKQKVLEPWKKFSGDFVSADAFIETLYVCLSPKTSEKHKP